MEINKGEGEQEGRRRLIKVKEYRGWTEINKTPLSKLYADAMRDQLLFKTHSVYLKGSDSVHFLSSLYYNLYP